MHTLSKTICAGVFFVEALSACKSPTTPSISTIGRVEGPSSLAVGDVVVYTGTITFSDGVARPTAAKIWTSSNQTVATIESSGRLTARAVGATIVSVSALATGGGTSTPGTLTVQVN